MVAVGQALRYIPAPRRHHTQIYDVSSADSVPATRVGDPLARWPGPSQLTLVAAAAQVHPRRRRRPPSRRHAVCPVMHHLDPGERLGRYSWVRSLSSPPSPPSDGCPSTCRKSVARVAKMSRDVARMSRDFAKMSRAVAVCSESRLRRGWVAARRAAVAGCRGCRGPSLFCVSSFIQGTNQHYLASKAGTTQR